MQFVPSKTHNNGDFLPDLCHVKSVLSLVLFAELLSISVTLASSGLTHFSWEGLSKVSILVLWIMLSSAAVLCPLRPWFARQNAFVAGSVSYLLVVAIAVLMIMMGQYLTYGTLLGQKNNIMTGTLIAAIFAGVVLRYFYLQQQLRNQQQAQLQANFNALQARIRPHFLFNSMNTIASLIAVEPNTAEKMIVTLSQLLRSSLSEDSIVSLNQEVNLCKDYIAMEQLRLGDRLRVTWQVGDIATHQTIPSLLLQPLLENAIYHGVQPIREGGEVAISIQQVEQNIVIRIRNPRVEQKGLSDGNGLALKNIQNRLTALYTKDGVVNIDKTDTEFCVHLRFPADR